MLSAEADRAALIEKVFHLRFIAVKKGQRFFVGFKKSLVGAYTNITAARIGVAALFTAGNGV